jgi:N-acetylglucosamine-6-phosphate deacetylase
VRLGVEAALVDGVLLAGDVEIADGRVARVGLEPAAGARGIAAPGLVDLQVNGFAGVDFLATDAEGVRTAAGALLACGVTAFQPTLITAAETDYAAALELLARVEGGARSLGAHLEGPFLSPQRPGAHPPEHLRLPDPAFLDRLCAAGPVAYVTLAPELPGALELVDHLHARGIVVSFGHSDATAEEAAAGFDRGVRTVTHLFNAMRPFGHRDPGIAGEALARPGVVVQLIVDGQHLAPATARTAFNAARGRVVLVSDAIAAAGTGDGVSLLGGSTVEVRDGVARRADGTLAGSTLDLLQAVREAHALGLPLDEALVAATAAPAAVLGRGDVGSIAPGATADVIVLDDRLDLVRVLRGGREAVAVQGA